MPLLDAGTTYEARARSRGDAAIAVVVVVAGRWTNASPSSPAATLTTLTSPLVSRPPRSIVFDFLSVSFFFHGIDMLDFFFVMVVSENDSRETTLRETRD